MSATPALAQPEQHKVTIDGESYSIVNVPDSSKLVLKAKSRILAEIQLDDLLSKLQLVGKLLFVAYNGVASQPGLRGQVSTLQVNYMRLCGKSQQAMIVFEDNCDAMLGNLKDLFIYLLSAKEDTALLYIAQMAQVAQSMAEQAKELETEFDGFARDATKALAGAEVAKGTEEEKRKAYEQARQNYEALTAGAKTLVEQIAKQKEKLQKLYEEAKEAAEKHENRAFAMGLTSAIFGGLGQGLGAAASMMAASKIPVSLPPAPPAAAPAAQQPVGVQAEAEKAKAALDKATGEATKAKEAVAVAEKDSGTAKGNVETLKGEVKAATAKLTAAKQVKTTKESELEKAKAAGKSEEIATATEAVTKAKQEAGTEETKKTEVESQLTTAEATASQAGKEVSGKQELLKTADAAEAQAKAKYEMAAAALKGLGAAMSGTADSLNKMGVGYADIAASYNEEKKKYLEMLLAQQTEEGKALASIKEYAVRMENLTGDVAVADVVIKALHQALAALKQIVVILSNATELWTQMATQCTRLSTGSNSLQSRVTLWMRTEKPQDRIKLYIDPPCLFMKDAVMLYAGWKALQIVTKEYSAAAQRVKTEVQDNVQKNVSTDNMLQLAINEGKALSLSATAGINGNNTEIAAIQAEQQKAA